MTTKAAWTPSEDWEPLSCGGGAFTVGVWRAIRRGRPWIVKRIRRDIPPADPSSFRWWRREIEVATSGLTSTFVGLTAPDYFVEEDDHGATLWSTEVAPSALQPRTVASALGTFGTGRPANERWFATGRLRDRLMLTDPAGPGILNPDYFRSSLLSTAMAIWDRREAALEILDGLPQVLSHGDALPRNFLRSDDGLVTAIDWDQLGFAPIGADLATYSMWNDVPTEELLESYIEGMGSTTVDPPDVTAGVALTTALIAISRAVRSSESEQAGAYRARLDRALPQLTVALKLIHERSG